MKQATFRLLLKSNEFILPFKFKHIINISSNIVHSLITSPDHTYQIVSNVNENVLQSFVDFLINDKIPIIDIDNINEFIELSNEFGILSEIIESKKEELGEYLININGLRFHKDLNAPKYEEEIAKKLDVYIENYGSALMKLPIQSLYNIFYHNERNLTKHNQAYENIKKEFELSNDSNIFILLESIDGTQLTRNNLEESISLRFERNNHMPTTDFTYLTTMIENQNVFKAKINELENKLIEYQKETKNQNEEIEALKKQINENESKNEDKLKNIEDKHKQEIEALNQKIDRLMNKINENEIANKNDIISITKNHEIEKEEIKNEFNDVIKNNYLSTAYSLHRMFTTQLNLSKLGIIGELKKREKNIFDKLFIVSQSSCDIYNLLNPSTNDYFGSSNKGNFYIEFELKEAVTMTGIKIFTSDINFPRSFNIEIDGKTVKSIDNSNDINGSNKEITVLFDPVRSQKIRFVQTGPNWDEGTNFLHFKRFELLSNEEKYSKGVFSTLVSESENCDPRKCGVYISSSSFDLNSFYLLEAKRNVITDNSKGNQLFQIELTRGVAILNGYRLIRGSPNKLRKYKIVATDDINTPIDKWTHLIEIDEKNENDNKNDDIYEFDMLSPPVKFIRIIQTGLNWSNDNYLVFIHFDIFGTYF